MARVSARGLTNMVGVTEVALLINEMPPTKSTKQVTECVLEASGTPVALPTKRFHEVPLFLVLYGQLELLREPV